MSRLAKQYKQVVWGIVTTVGRVVGTTVGMTVGTTVGMIVGRVVGMIVGGVVVGADVVGDSRAGGVKVDVLVY